MKKLFKTLTKRLTLFILAIILVGGPILYLLSLNSNSVKAAWFDDNWAYRQTVNITNSGTAQTDFQISITLDTATLITAGKMQNSCADIRIVDNTSKVIPHWIEDGTADCNTSTTKIWTKVPSILTTGTTLFVYYGNPSAANTENPKQVFSYFENFESYTATSGITSAGWVDLSSDNSVATSHMSYNSSNGSNNSKAMLLDPAGGSGWKRASTYLSSQAFASGSVLEYFYKATNDNYYDGPSGFSNRTTTVTAGAHMADGTNMVVFDGNDDGSNDTFKTMASSTQTSTAASVTRTGSHKVGIYWGSTSRFYFDGSLIASNTTNIPSGSLYIFLSQFLQSSDAGVGYFDDIRVRKYAATEPTTANATEETTPGPIAYWKFDEGTGAIASDATSSRNNGTISGAAWQTEDQCITGKCLYFDGTDDYVNTTYSKASGDGTVAVWFRAQTQTSDTGSIFRPIIEQGNFDGVGGTNPEGILINMTRSGSSDVGKINANWGNDSTGLSSSETYDDNRWHYVVITKSGTTGTLYIDGISKGTWVATDTVNTGTNFQIGGSTTASARKFKGFIDEAKIYPYARTASQILTDYNSRGSAKGTSAALSASSSNNSALSNGLVGYWKMDEASGTTTAADASGNSKTGTSSSSTNVTTGKFSNARSFNGSQNVTVSSLNLTGSAVSVSAWIKPNSATVTDFSRIVSTGNSGPYSFILAYGSTAGGDKNKIRFLVTTTNGAVGSVSTTSLNSTSTWYHVVGVYDGSNIYIYVNGVKEDSHSKAGSLSNTSNNLGIGAEYDNTLNFDGNIDEARIYNRALSPAEVSQLYTFAPGPVGYWSFDDGTGASAQDKSGNGNTGTWNGTLGSQWKPGKYGAGGNFDGSTNYVDAGNASNLQLTTGTVEAWIKTSSAGSSYRGILIKQSAYGIFLKDNVFMMYDWGASADRSSGVNLGDGGWHHVACSFQSGVSNGTLCYIDGVLRLTTTITVSSQTLGVQIGYGNSGSQYFTGLIDEPKIYNYARTAKQITEDMNAGHPAVGSPVGSAIGHWDFDEGFGTTTNNSGNQGSTLNGSMSGFASPATATSGWTQSGKFGKALLFDGSNDYINAGVNTMPSGAYTKSAWVKRNGGTNNNIISGADTGNVSRHAFWAPTSYSYKLSAGHNGTWNYVQDPVALDANWHYVAVTYDPDISSGLMVLYKDGVEVNRATSVPAPTLTTGQVYIGSYEAGSNLFTGTIDEPKVYNYALTANEVKIDMNRGQAQVLGTLSDNSTYQKQAANQEYCVPGDTTSCAAPVGEWSLEQTTGSTVRDTSGNAFNGSFVGTSNPAWTTGKYGGALKFTSASSAQDDVEVPDNATLSFTNNQITISAWINPTTTTGYTAAAGKYKCGLSYEEYVLGISSGKAVMRAGNSSGTSAEALGATTLSTNTWYHLEGTYNGTTSKIYVNGILDGSTDLGISMYDSVASFTIGALDSDETNPACSNRYTQRQFNGKVDQVRLFNYVRSPAQVAWDYNRGAPVSYWDFDECQGSVVNDSSGNRNTGTITVATGNALGTCNTSSTFWGGSGGTGAGKINYSPTFDGTDDYVNVGDPSSGIFDMGTNDLSVSFWLKTTDTAGYIISKAYNTPYWGLSISTNKISPHLHNGTTSTSVKSVTSINDGNWHHIAATYKRSGNLTVFVDGKSENTVSISGDSAVDISNSNNFSLMANCNPGCADVGNFVSGQLDDVKIFNYALSSTQVKNLYNGGGAVRFGPSTGTP